jgi:SAM-dependent methyltransferase/uncharacterized C2H2 Zn-finger protein
MVSVNSARAMQPNHIREDRWRVARIKEWRDRAGKRILRCPDCGIEVPTSIVPHLRKVHPATWDEYVRIFREMHAKGYSYKKIMYHFGRSFTWLVIARELTDHDGMLREIEPTKVRLPGRIAPQTTTLWSFKDRGSWGVHDSKYRGNWAPEVPRNIIERYSKRGELVVDPFVGGGTTVLEAMLCGRRSIGCDVSGRALRLATHKTAVLAAALKSRRRKVPEYRIVLADARTLPLADESADLVCAHPPYLDIIAYTRSNHADLSRITDPTRFVNELRKTVTEMHRVLKVGGHCAVLIGDVRRQKQLIPLGFLTLRAFLDAFDLKEVIVKEQPKSAMSEFWSKRSNGAFYNLAHEYLFVFQKPTPGADLAPYLRGL